MKIPHIIVETLSYISSVNKIWTEDEKEEFNFYIALNMLEGDLIPNTNGLRKIRWRSSGRGKRGGARVIYFYYNETAPIYLLYAYPKGSQENLTPEETKIFREIVSVLKHQLKGGKSIEKD